MNKWTIIFYQTASGRDQVNEFIDSLSPKEQAKIHLGIELLREHGLRLPAPYLKKLAGTKKVWELKTGVYRIFLSPLPERNILLIHMIFKKKKKTPRKDLKLAEARLKDYLNSLRGG